MAANFVVSAAEKVGLLISFSRVDRVPRKPHDLSDLEEFSAFLPDMSKKDSPRFAVPIEHVIHSQLLRAWSEALLSADIRASLEKYYETVAPQNAAEVLGIEPIFEWQAGPALTAVAPWRRESPNEICRHRMELMRTEAKEFGISDWSDSDGWKGFGPVSHRLIALESTRLRSVLGSIRQRGFVGLIPSGVLFAKQGSVLVKPEGGWHRTAAALASGFLFLPIRIVPQIPIEREHAAHWPHVRDGLFTIEQAQSVFDRQFRPLNLGYSE